MNRQGNQKGSGIIPMMINQHPVPNLNKMDATASAGRKKIISNRREEF